MLSYEQAGFPRTPTTRIEKVDELEVFYAIFADGEAPWRHRHNAGGQTRSHPVMSSFSHSHWYQ